MAEENIKKKKSVLAELFPEEMPILVLRGLVMFPNMILHFDVAREKSMRALSAALGKDRKIFLVTQKDISMEHPTPKDIYNVGVVAEIRQVVKSEKTGLRVVVEGEYRAKLLNYTNEDPHFQGVVEKYPIKRQQRSDKLDAYIRTVKNYFDEYCELSPMMPADIITTVMVSENPTKIVEFLAGNIPFDFKAKQKVLEESSPLKRLELISYMLEEENRVLRIEKEIDDKVHEDMDRNQREYFLKEQRKIISQELGEDNFEEEQEKYRKKILSIGLKKEHEDKLLSELNKYVRMADNSQEAAVIRNYLDTVLELPWNVSSNSKIDIAKAKRTLDSGHYGLTKVKERILESIAVKKLTDNANGNIICLVGPPGVGKTSIAKAIAEAIGRKYVRISLGGIRDEAEIRGHRKTYIGSMPGRIITALKEAGTNNPLMLFDEIDKLSSDYKGDPSSAMLEVLDGEQNVNFTDHYIEVPFDLSKVFFIATANNAADIPAPLYDRMEIIEISSYTREEKFQIAKRHLIRKQLKENGLTNQQVSIAPAAIYKIIDCYTAEAGVRDLERQIASILRKCALKIVSDKNTGKISINGKNVMEYLGTPKFKEELPIKEDTVGVANGLAWTSIGGALLEVEVAVLPGEGKHQFTGSLGDVMKESVGAAVTYIRSIASQLKIDTNFYKNTDIHIHFPEGATPKDGPSAGITICTAVTSALTGIPVRHDIAMTGEITLRGKVLPIGGLREKTMAAYKKGMKKVIIPFDNIPDLDDVEDIVKENVVFVPVKTAGEVLKIALADNDIFNKSTDFESNTNRYICTENKTKEGSSVSCCEK